MMTIPLKKVSFMENIWQSGWRSALFKEIARKIQSSSIALVHFGWRIISEQNYMKVSHILSGGV
jgi:hypothetical protein